LQFIFLKAITMKNLTTLECAAICGGMAFARGEPSPAEAPPRQGGEPPDAGVDPRAVPPAVISLQPFVGVDPVPMQPDCMAPQYA
jgi:hypothetical protein